MLDNKAPIIVISNIFLTVFFLSHKYPQYSLAKIEINIPAAMTVPICPPCKPWCLKNKGKKNTITEKVEKSKKENTESLTINLPPMMFCR